MTGCNEISAQKELSILSRSVSENTARSLDLLRAIEQTIDHLSWISNHAKTNTGWTEKAADTIKQCDREVQIDPDHKFCSNLEVTQTEVNNLYEKLIAKRKAAETADELHDDDGVVEAYTAAIAQIADLHNALNDLRWAIMEHDADLEKEPAKSYADIDEMFADLDV